VLPDRVRRAIEGLSRAGADFVVAACNSVHVVYHELDGTLPIPWVSIMDAAGEKLSDHGLRRVGLLGTVFTMQNDFYARTLKAYGVDVLVPAIADQEKLNTIIYEELVRNTVTPESRQTVQGMIASLRQEGADGVILGCTELPFLIRPEDADLPVFDTTAIHARKALALALE